MVGKLHGKATTTGILMWQKEGDVEGGMEEISGTLRTRQTDGDRMRELVGRSRGAGKDRPERSAGRGTGERQFGE